MNVEITPKEVLKKNYDSLMFQVRGHSKATIVIEDGVPIKYQSLAIKSSLQKKIFKLLSDGLKVSDIEDEVGVSATTIGHYRRDWNKMGYLQ